MEDDLPPKKWKTSSWNKTLKIIKIWKMEDNFPKKTLKIITIGKMEDDLPCKNTNSKNTGRIFVIKKTNQYSLSCIAWDKSTCPTDVYYIPSNYNQTVLLH